MAWPSEFRDALLAGPRGYAYALRFSPNTTGSGVGYEYLITSSPILGGQTLLLARTLSLTGTQLDPLSWRYQGGAVSVEILLPDDPALSPGEVLRRGTLAELLIGIDGAPLEEFQPLRLLILQNVTSLSRVHAKLELWDIIQYLRGRPEPLLSGGLPQARIFHSVAGTETTVASNYSAGGASLVLASATGFKTFDGTGLAEVESDAGDVFYVTFTGISTNTLTGVTGGVLGTTDAAASVGKTVRSLAYLSGHPLTIAERMLVSTGTSGANGLADVYPVQAGFAIDQTWIDSDEFTRARRVAAAGSGSTTWTVAVAEPQDDAMMWLQSLLNEGGMLLCQRQGRIVGRAVPSPKGNPFYPAAVINDTHIVGQPQCQWFNSSQREAYNRVTVHSEQGTTSKDRSATSLPVRDEIVYDLSAAIRTNELAQRGEIADRLRLYAHYGGEVVTLTVAGLGWGLCVGDQVSLSTQRVRGRLAQTYGGYVEQIALVIGYSENIGVSQPGPSVDLELLITPYLAPEDYGLQDGDV